MKVTDGISRLISFNSQPVKTSRRNSTGANRGRTQNLCSLRSLLFKSGPDGDADFVFLACRAGVGRRPARDTASPYIDNRPLLVATKPELREYKAVYVQSDAEIGLLSDEVVVNCAP